MNPTDALVLLLLFAGSAGLPAPTRTTAPEPGPPGQPPIYDWKRVGTDLALTFPADHGAHPEFETEWWYLTGQLEDEAGARFGFQFTLFRRGLEPGASEPGQSPLRAREAFAGHLALTEVAAGRTRFAERLRRGSPLARAARTDLDVCLEDWSLVRVPATADAPEELRLVAADPARAFGFDFVLRPAKPLVLHGERGYSRKGSDPGNASAYVSWPRLEVAGRLQLDGAAHPVHGRAWYDHEFGSSVLADGAVGWDWFALQLDDGRELMLFQLRDEQGAPLKASAATLIERDGTPRPLRGSDFTLRSNGAWASPRTPATYPSGWTITLPSAALELVLVPLVVDCEIVSAASTGVTYWEGPVELRGAVTGRGYAELTGYAGSLSARF